MDVEPSNVAPLPCKLSAEQVWAISESEHYMLKTHGIHCDTTREKSGLGMTTFSSIVFLNPKR